jgi:hypothetical protein
MVEEEALSIISSCQLYWPMVDSPCFWIEAWMVEIHLLLGSLQHLQWME